MTTTEVTRTCQDDPFTTASLVAALEQAWTAIRHRHLEVPAVVIIVGSGSAAGKASAPLKYGHYATLRWQLGDTRLPEVLVSGEGLRRTPTEVLTTLLHEAAHALADRRGIQDTSRQGRWHNQRFAALARELGLQPTKDQRIGWSPCTLHPDTADLYASTVDTLTAAMRAWRHAEQPTETTRKNNNNGLALTCECDRRIRVSKAVAEAGPITCGLCDTPFLTDEQRENGEPQVSRSHRFDPDGRHHGGVPTYPYKTAPKGLATVRQLRALNLRPGGQGVAAQILWRNGKRVAYLYRIDLARPKRQATPAQQAAIAKALLARRFCTTCRSTKDYYIPRRYGECLDCAPQLRAA